MKVPVSPSTTSNLIDLIRNEDIQQTHQTQAPGVGVAGQTTPAPDVLAVALGTSFILAAVMESVGAMSETALKSTDADVALLEAQTALDKLMQDVDNGQVKNDTARQRAQLGEKEKQIKEAQQKIDEAEEKQKNLSVWDKIKLAFQWLGSILSIAIGALMIATGAGAVLGGLMIAAGLVGIVQAIDSTMKATNENHLGMAGQAAVARGESLDKAKEDDKICSYALMGVTAALALASLVGGIVNLVKAIAATTAEVAEVVAETTVQVASEAVAEAQTAAATTTEVVLEASDAAKMALRGTELANDVMQISEGIGSGVVAGLQYVATTMRAEGERQMSNAKKMDAMLQQLADFIDMAINRIKQHNEAFAQMVDDTVGAMRDRADALARVRFQ